MVCWPPPAEDLAEEDEPDGMRGCKACIHKYVDLSWAWSAFNEEKHNLRDSWCLGRDCPRFITTIQCTFCGIECSEVSYEVSDEDNIRCCIACFEADNIKYKDARFQKHGHGATISVYEDAEEGADEIGKERREEECKKVEEDSTNNSNADGPQSSADLLLPSEPHQPPSFLQQQQQPDISLPPLQPRVPKPAVTKQCVDEEIIDKAKKEELKKVEEEDSITISFMDGPQSSAELLPPSFPHHVPVFPQKHHNSSLHLQQNQTSPLSLPPKVFWRPWEDPTEAKVSPDPPPRRLIRRAKKRSLGDLARRRQRLYSYQNNQAHPFPCTPEPDQSRLESSSWVGGPRKLDWSGMTDVREDPPPSQSWCSSTGWMYSPSPGPPSPPPWLPSNMAPPSPVYCDGCHSWGNLLTVTVSPARGI